MTSSSPCMIATGPASCYAQGMAEQEGLSPLVRVSEAPPKNTILYGIGRVLEANSPAAHSDRMIGVINRYIMPKLKPEQQRWVVKHKDAIETGTVVIGTGASTLQIVAAATLSIDIYRKFSVALKNASLRSQIAQQKLAQRRMAEAARNHMRNEQAIGQWVAGHAATLAIPALMEALVVTEAPKKLTGVAETVRQEGVEKRAQKMFTKRHPVQERGGSEKARVAEVFQKPKKGFDTAEFKEEVISSHPHDETSLIRGGNGNVDRMLQAGVVASILKNRIQTVMQKFIKVKPERAQGTKTPLDDSWTPGKNYTQKG